jgi:hypothetical protein
MAHPVVTLSTMDPVPRTPWRIRRPGSTGLVVIAFLGVLLLWVQVRPGQVPIDTRPVVTSRPATITDTIGTRSP